MPMAIFDYYVMVDWSGGGRRRGNMADAIWIAHGARNAPIPDTESPYSRTEAERRIRQIVSANLEEDPRVLLCCDFGYGYPGGFSAGLPAASGSGWKAVWNYLHAALRDDIGTTPGGIPTNRNNRFDVAEAINSFMSPATGLHGPFWCLPNAGTHPHIPQIGQCNLFPRHKAAYCRRFEKPIKGPGAIPRFVSSEPEAWGARYSPGSRACTP